MLAETPEEFAEAISALISQPAMAVSIIDEAWKFAKDYYSWEPLCDRLAILIGKEE
jgi:glycosyltransferase involved in cell wall biosynthesis